MVGVIVVRLVRVLKKIIADVEELRLEEPMTAEILRIFPGINRKWFLSQG
jgi:hypothetical protein